MSPKLRWNCQSFLAVGEAEEETIYSRIHLSMLQAQDLRASPAGRRERPPRVQMRPRGQKNGEKTSQRPDPNSQTWSGQPILGPNVGTKWVNADKRTIRARVHACLLVSSPGPPCRHRGDQSSPLGSLHCRFNLAQRVIGIDATPGFLCRPSTRSAMPRRPRWAASGCSSST
jgi:hypothetical protein